jgi:hypothetical protein
LKPNIARVWLSFFGNLFLNSTPPFCDQSNKLGCLYIPHHQFGKMLFELIVTEETSLSMQP